MSASETMVESSCAQLLHSWLTRLELSSIVEQLDKTEAATKLPRESSWAQLLLTNWLAELNSPLLRSSCNRQLAVTKLLRESSWAQLLLTSWLAGLELSSTTKQLH